MHRYLVSILLAFLMLILTLGGGAAQAQSGVVNIPSNTFLVTNLGPGPGLWQIPPPGPGVTRLMVGVQVTWDHTLSSEVGPFMNQQTVGGFWSHSWNRVDYWTMTAGVGPDGPITLMGDRLHPTPLGLNYTIPMGTMWDGVVDWQGPTAFASMQTVAAPQFITTLSLNTLTFPDPDYSLWLKVKTSGTPGVSTVLGGDGVPYLKLDSPWRATVTYEYLP